MAQFVTRKIEQSFSSESIIFFGTGEVSLSSLKHLSTIYRIEAIITKPDSTNHGKTKYPEVKKWALENSIDLIQPKSKKQLTEAFESVRYLSRLAVVIDYGIIIDQDVIDYFPLGIINSHFSLLPEWRGADPITFSLLSGQDETGVSLMRIDAKLDEGDILAQEGLKIAHDETNQSLSQRLISLSNKLLQEYLPLYIAGKINLRPQSSEGISYAKKIAKSDGELDFTKPADRLEREVRAYQPWPGSYTSIDGTVVTVTDAKVSILAVEGLNPGTVVLLSKNRLGIVSASDVLEITSLKPQGKGMMSASAFLAGRQDLKSKLKLIEAQD